MNTVFLGKITENNIFCTFLYLGRKTDIQTGKRISQRLLFTWRVVGMGSNPKSPSSLAPLHYNNYSENNKTTPTIATTCLSKHRAQHFNAPFYLIVTTRMKKIVLVVSLSKRGNRGLEQVMSNRCGTKARKLQKLPLHSLQLTPSLSLPLHGEALKKQFSTIE